MEEIRIFGIKAFDPKDRGDVIIAGLFILPLMMSFLGALGGGGTYETNAVTQQTCYSGPITEYNYRVGFAGRPDCPGIAEERAIIRSRVENPVPKSIPNYKEKADTILANIDPGLRGHISSVNILDMEQIIQICRDVRAGGCAITNLDGNGIVATANIYVKNDYDDSCFTFEWVLYHEIGHIEEFYRYGSVASRSEYYADNFASQYVNMKC